MKLNSGTTVIGQAVHLLQQKRLDEALNVLYNEAARRGMHDLAQDIKQTQENYSRLMQYFKQGLSDPTRMDQLNSLFASAWNDASRLDTDNTAVKDNQLGDGITLELIKGYQMMSMEGQLRDRNLGLLFLHIRKCIPLNRDIRSALNQMMLNDEFPVYERATLLSAILLNLLEAYDANMIECIYTYTLEDQPAQIRMQALVTLVLCGMAYDQRIAHEPRLRELYKLLTETEGDYLAAIQLSMLCCKSAVDFDDRLNSVIKVELGRIRAGKPHSSLKEFLQLFRDGSDPDYNSFRMLCKHEFFSLPENEHHWLMPFDQQHYKAQELSLKNPDAKVFIRLMAGSSSQCNSSKYAHLIIVEKQLSSILSQMMEQLKNLPLDAENICLIDEFSTIRTYLHDLYRYLTLNETGKKMDNLLQGNTDFYDITCLRESMEDTDRLEMICRTLYEQKRYGDAAIRLKRLTQVRADAQLLDMLADAASQSRNFQLEQEALSRYAALYPVHESILVRRAKSYHAVEAFVSEENLLHEAIRQFPSSSQLMLQMSACLNAQQRFNEALTVLENIALPDDEGQQSFYHYQMAYASLLSGNLNEAQLQAEKGLKTNLPHSVMFQIMIFADILSGQIVQAHQHYNALAELYGNEKAYLLLLKDKVLLRSIGEDDIMLTLLHDSFSKTK